MSPEELASRLEDDLVERLRAWARRNWPKEPVAAFGLVFTIGLSPLPGPGLATLGLVEELVSDPDEFGVGLVAFNPAEYEIFDEGFLESVPSEVQELAEALNEAWMEREEDDNRWVEFMGGVAARLAAEDWSDLPRTEDFVVYASTAEVETQTELEGHLAHSVPAAILIALRERGVLHVTPLEDL